MDTPAAPLAGTYTTVITHALALARTGDMRARPVTINGRRAILTPHRDSNGNLDADDLAAQVYAAAHGLTSDDGAYTGGYFSAEGSGHHVTAALDEDVPPNEL